MSANVWQAIDVAVGELQASAADMLFEGPHVLEA